MSDAKAIEQALRDALPVSSQTAIPELAQILADASSGAISTEEAQALLTARHKLARIIYELNGQLIKAGGSEISFGEGSQLGDIKLYDVVGRDVVTITVNLGLPQASAPILANPAHIFILIITTLGILIPLFISFPRLLSPDNVVLTAEANTQIAVATSSAQTAQTILTATALSQPSPTITLQPTAVPVTQYLEVAPASGQRFPINREFPVRITLGYSTQPNTTFQPRPNEPSGFVATPRPLGTPGLPLQEQRGSGYDAFITTRLTGSGEIKPPEQVRYQLLDQDEVTWVWIVVPSQPGPINLFLEVFVEWVPENGGDATKYQVLAETITGEIYTPLVVFGNPVEFTTIIIGIGSLLGGALLTWFGQKVVARLEHRSNKSNLAARPPTRANKRKSK